MNSKNKTKKLLLLGILLFGFTASGWSQKVSLNFKDEKIEKVLSSIKSQTGMALVFSDQVVDVNRLVSIQVKDCNLEEALGKLLTGTKVAYEIKNNKIYFIEKESEITTPSKRKKVTGIVTDATGEPIIGANVVERNVKTNGVITDIDGQFSLEIDVNGELLVTYIGYVAQNVSTKGKESFKIVLQEDTQTLEEVVVVGYGSQKKLNLTGSVATVGSEELTERPITNVTAAIQGAVPGMTITSGQGRPGQDAGTIRVRGTGTLNNSDPYILVDGIETGTMNSIDPNDIESISVLKDAASAAIYGSKAANGVILITTKRPKGETTFQLNYNNNFAFASAMNLPEQAPLTEYLKAYSDAAGDQFWTMGSPSVTKWLGYLEQYRNNPSSIPTVGDGIYKDADGGIYYMNEKDLVKNMLETSFQQTHNISMTGGTNKLRYRLSAGYISHDGVLITNKDKYERMNVSGFISADITKWFTQEATFSYAHSKNMEPKSALGAIYSTRLASFYPEGNMPEGCSIRRFAIFYSE